NAPLRLQCLRRRKPAEAQHLGDHQAASGPRRESADPGGRGLQLGAWRRIDARNPRLRPDAAPGDSARGADDGPPAQLPSENGGSPGMNEWIAKLFPQSEAWTSFWSTLEFGREARAGWILAFVALFLAASWLYRKDTRALHPFWKAWLWGLRI